MKSTAPSHDEIGNELLDRMRLVQVARGSPATFWRSHVETRGKSMLALLGVCFVYFDFVESLPHTWMLLLGMCMLVVGFSPRRDDSSDRLDALIQFLDREGQLSVGDAGIQDEPSA